MFFLSLLVITVDNASAHKMQGPIETTSLSNQGDKKVYKQTVAETSDIGRFKEFIALFLRSISTNDTLFLKAHIKFPLKNSDFGAMITPGEENQLKSINKKFFFQHLKKFFPSSIMSDIQKDGSFSYNYRVPKPYYFLSLSQPGDGDITVSYRWFFLEEGGVFYLTDFTIEAG